MQARTPGVVWAMSRSVFRSIILAGRVQKRARYEEVLGDMEIFQSLSAANRSSIADCLTSEVYQVGCLKSKSLKRNTRTSITPHEGASALFFVTPAPSEHRLVQAV